ncbi:hypothetical protein ANCCAN_28133 [Ancylostoma caninum]|uniref:PPIase cyclophilin-type domain-containing protein n=1 Tax=Ancylostoma caninum TaxID=29170 RepID=A0A368F7I4_ANCCA|nr:hypothetical protein ANCCAN_28133 [Ancylostoma caninum]
MSVTLHTTVGDIKVELFCQECPKTCENFLALCASDYYKDNIFHRHALFVGKEIRMKRVKMTYTGLAARTIKYAMLGLRGFAAEA